jgi:ankyrin repeat protein
LVFNLKRRHNPERKLTSCSDAHGLDANSLTKGIVAEYVNTLSNVDDRLQQAAIHLSVEADHTEITKTLLDNGADINIQDGNESTPLHLAAEKDNLEMVKLLLDCGALIEARDEILNTPLMSALADESRNSARLLIERGANIFAKSSSGRNLLYLALKQHEYKDTEMFEYLLDLGVDPREPCDDGTCVLHECILYPNFLSLLLRRNLLVTAPPLHIPIFNPWAGGRLSDFLVAISRLRRVMPVEQLRSIIDIEPPGKISLLCRAAAGGFTYNLDHIFKIGGNLEHEGCEQGTALMAACYHGQFDMVRVLVRKGAKLTCLARGRPTSAVVCAQAFPDIVDWLLVKQYISQFKIEFAPTEGPEREIRPWSGIGEGKLDLRGYRSRQSDNSSVDYAIRVADYRRSWLGEVIPVFRPEGERSAWVADDSKSDDSSSVIEIVRDW